MVRTATTRHAACLLTMALIVLSFPVIGGQRVATAARTYYVAASGPAPTSDPKPGNCPGGTREEPWGDTYVRGDGARIHQIEYAMRCLTAGDTLIILGGTYTDRVMPYLVDENRGTSSSPVRVVVAPGQRAVIRGLIRIDQPDHWHLEGIDITNDGGAYGSGEYLLKVLGGKGWSFRGGEIWNTKADSYAAVRVEVSTPKAGSNPHPSDWSFVGNCVHDTNDVHPGTVDHNLYIHTGETSGPGLIERNVIFNASGGHNIKLGNNAGQDAEDATANVVVRNNTLFNAVQNVLVIGPSHHNTIRRNMFGRVLDKEWYPNVRGYSLTGTHNAVVENAGYTANSEGQMTLVGKEDDAHRDSTQGFATSGNLFPVTPQFDSTSVCDGFYPTKDSYRWYGALAPVTSADPIERISGTDRVETAIEISKTARPSSGAKNVVIARADNYPDALAGAPLAAALDAPILLSGGKSLHPEVKKEIQRLGAGKAVLLGGRAALSDQVRKDLEAINVTVQRIEGSDRFATAANVAHELGKLTGTDVRNPYVVEGQDADPNRGWPDAVAVGFLAAQQKRPILLVTTETLPNATNAALKDLSAEHATIIGGTASVSESVAKAVNQAVGTVARIAGDSRYHTSRLVADVAVKAGARPAQPWFATGAAFPDALAAGPAVAKDGGVLLLVPGHTTFLNGEASDWLDRYDGPIGRLRLIGGPAAVSHGIEDKARYQLLFK